MKKRSITSWLRIFWSGLLVIMMLAALIAGAVVRQKLVEQKSTQMKESFRIYASQLDQNLDSIHNILYMEFHDSESSIRIQTGGTKTQMAFARMDVAKTLNRVLGWVDDVDSLVFYCPTGQDGDLIETGDDNDADNRLQLKKVLAEDINRKIKEQTIGRDGFITYTINGTGYLVRIYIVNQSYVSVVVRTSSAIEPLRNYMDTEGCAYFLTDSEGNILESTGSGDLTKVDLSCDGEFIRVNGKKYLQIVQPSDEGDFYVGAWVDKNEVYGGIQQILYILLLFMAILLLLIPAGSRILKQLLNRPVMELLDGMKAVGNGDLNTEVPENGKVEEFSTMAGSFNHMVGEIRDLKIRDYENKLAVQKASLQYLQLQINPHFYLNALNIIYSMAEVHDYKKIQEMTLSLVRYLRYIFQDATTLVPLQSELDHVKAYIDIQQMRFSDSIDFIEDIDEDALNVEVPPFIIQSFVENSIKYALREHKENIIEITAAVREQDDRKNVVLTIWDNGNGYDPAKLDDLNAGKFPQTDSQHNIGLRNVKQRLDIIYGGRAGLRFENLEGALTTITIPFE